MTALGVWLCVIFAAIFVFAWMVGRMVVVAADRRKVDRLNRLTMERLHGIGRRS